MVPLTWKGFFAESIISTSVKPLTLWYYFRNINIYLNYIIFGDILHFIDRVNRKYIMFLFQITLILAHVILYKTMCVLTWINVVWNAWGDADRFQWIRQLALPSWFKHMYVHIHNWIQQVVLRSFAYNLHELWWVHVVLEPKPKAQLPF